MYVPLKAIKTPCIRLCELDCASGICKGCGRFEIEIECWMSMSPEEREAIINECSNRLDKLYGGTEQ